MSDETIIISKEDVLITVVTPDESTIITAGSQGPQGIQGEKGDTGTSPLTTKGDLLAFSTLDIRLPVGVDGLVLTADSSEATGIKWEVGGDDSPLTTKGDIFAYSTVDARLPVGANDLVLTADSAEATGLKWAAGGGGGTPGGADTQVQYNNGGAFGGAKLYYDDVNERVGVIETTPLAKHHISTGTAAEIGQIIQGVAAQSANRTEWRDNTGNVDLAVTSDGDLFTDRWLGDSTNVFIGVGVAGLGNLAHSAGNEGYQNNAIGALSLNAISTGYQNNAMGYRALNQNTTGYQNNAIGPNCMFSNTTGTANNAVGNTALFYNTTGTLNTAIGNSALLYNTDGDQNVGIGNRALYENTTGYKNVAIGGLSGRWTAATGENQTGYESVFIGNETRANADAENNQIVIGFQAVGNGSNTVTIGNASITDNYFNGNIKATAGDVETTGSANGLILESPDATRYRVTVANGGTLSISAV